jgi:hypothetical protein
VPAGRARLLLALGALAGAALAAASLLRGGEAEAPAGPPADGVVAWVNGRPIARETFARFVGAAARERGVLELDPDMQRRLLERLVDEELLLQRGLELDLARREPAARRAIVSAVVDTLTAGDVAEPDPADLEAFYAETRERWLGPGPMQVEALLGPREGPGGSEGAAHARAAELARRARERWDVPALVASGLARLPEPALPGGLAPPERLRERLGAAAYETLLGLEPGEVGGPARGPEGWWVLRLVARGPGSPPPLDRVLESVRAAWLQARHEERLGEALSALRARADVRVVDPALAD